MIKKYFTYTFSGAAAWIYFICGLFIVSGIVGFVAFYYDPGFLQTILSVFQKIINSSGGSNQGLVRAIFEQNLISSLTSLLSGILLGFIPLLIIVFNGFLIGFVINDVIKTLSYPLWEKILVLLLTLLPHGIFELPAVIISAAFGLRLGVHWLAGSSRGRRWQVWKQDLYKALLFIPLLAVVLIIAATIEVYVSGALAQMFIK